MIYIIIVFLQVFIVCLDLFFFPSLLHSKTPIDLSLLFAISMVYLFQTKGLFSILPGLLLKLSFLPTTIVVPTLIAYSLFILLSFLFKNNQQSHANSLFILFSYVVILSLFIFQFFFSCPNPFYTFILNLFLYTFVILPLFYIFSKKLFSIALRKKPIL